MSCQTCKVRQCQVLITQILGKGSWCLCSRLCGLHSCVNFFFPFPLCSPPPPLLFFFIYIAVFKTVVYFQASCAIPLSPLWTFFGYLCSINEYTTWKTMSSKPGLLQLWSFRFLLLAATFPIFPIKWGRVCDSSGSCAPEYLALLFLSLRTRAPAGKVWLWIFSDVWGATEGPCVFLPGHKGSLLLFVNSASGSPSPDLNSVTRVQRGHCWQFLQPHQAQLCKPAGNKRWEWQTCLGREKLPEQFQRCLKKGIRPAAIYCWFGWIPVTFRSLDKCQDPLVLIHLKSNWTFCCGSQFPYGEASSITVQSSPTIWWMTFSQCPAEMREESDRVWGKLWHLRYLGELGPLFL